MVFISELKPGKLYNVNHVNITGNGCMVSVEMFLSCSKVTSDIDGYTHYDLKFLRGKLTHSYSFLSNTSIDKEVSVTYLSELAQ